MVRRFFRGKGGGIMQKTANKRSRAGHVPTFFQAVSYRLVPTVKQIKFQEAVSFKGKNGVIVSGFKVIVS